MIYNQSMDYLTLPEIPCVYMLKNLINGKIYIGKANDLRLRMRYHWYNLSKNENQPLQNSIRKHGWDNFECTIIEEVPIEQLIERETYYILKYKSTDKTIGYNVLTHGFDRSGIPHREEVKKQISESCKKNAKRGDEHPIHTNPHMLDNIKIAHKNNTGKHRSEETKAKISAGHKGKAQFYNRKPVKQIDPNTNEIIKVWDSMQLAAEGLGKKWASSIRTVINKRPNRDGIIQKTAFGFKWELV